MPTTFTPKKTDAFKYDLKSTKSAEEIKSIYLSVYNSIVLMEYDLIYVRFFLYYRLDFDPKPDWLILCWSVYFLQGVSAEGNDE